MAYSEDYRRRTIEYHGEGHTLAEVYAAFKVYPGTLRDWEARNEAGILKPVYPRSRKPRKLVPEELIRYVEDHPDDFLSEIGKHFQSSGESVRKALKKLKITRKKRRRDTKNVLRMHVQNTSKK